MRLLIIEDDPSMAASLARGLTAEGYVIEVASDGDDGLERCLTTDYDAIVLDIMLPKLNGFALVSALRAARSTTPVLMLTAKTGEWDQAEALDAGADDFLSKPFSYPVLLARLRALIRRGSAGASATLQVGAVSIDTAARRCWSSSGDIDLTAREFELLAYLMHRPGTVVSKLDLLHHVWDLASESGTNVVEVYIGYLRRKLGATTSGAAIETIRGAGYRLVSDV